MKRVKKRIVSNRVISFFSHNPRHQWYRDDIQYKRKYIFPPC